MLKAKRINKTIRNLKTTPFTKFMPSMPIILTWIRKISKYIFQAVRWFLLVTSIEKIRNIGS